LRIVASLFLSLSLAASSIHSADSPPQGLALTHITVVKTASLELQSDQTVVIADGRIKAIAPSEQIQPSKNSHVIDAHGKFLIPGLWDMHVHLAGVSADPVWSREVLLPLLLASGITGVRDMGGDLEALLAWKHEKETGTLLAPHFVASGPWLAGGGHKTSEQYPISNPEEARAAVRELKRRGADFIKVISVPSKEVFFAVADEAKKQEIPFSGHLPFQISATEASNAGMRSIEHFLYSAFSLSFSSKEEDLRQRLIIAEAKGDSVAWEAIAHEADASYSAEKAAALLQTLRKNGTWVTPTLASLNITTHPGDWRMDDPLLAFVPPALAKQWRDSFNDDRMKKRAAWLGRQASNDWKLTSELHQAGIPLLVGSDSLDPFVFPGESLHKELGELVRAGFSPGEALRSATLGAVRFLNKEGNFGTIEKGKVADLVMLSANPLDNVANVRKIDAVILGGKYLDRAAIDRLLAGAKAAAISVK
jgi:imidazolonepropionase-like amidohydrolase